MRTTGPEQRTRRTRVPSASRLVHLRKADGIREENEVCNKDHKRGTLEHQPYATGPWSRYLVEFVYRRRAAAGTLPRRHRLHRRPSGFRPNHLRRHVAVGSPLLVDDGTTAAAFTLGGTLVALVAKGRRRGRAGGRGTFCQWVDPCEHLHVVQDLQSAEGIRSFGFGGAHEGRGGGAESKGRSGNEWEKLSERSAPFAPTDPTCGPFNCRCGNGHIEQNIRSRDKITTLLAAAPWRVTTTGSNTTNSNTRQPTAREASALATRTRTTKN